MVTREAQAAWEGDLEQGQGTMELGGGALEVPYCFGSRFEDGSGGNPEELIGAAHAGCFSMALAHELGEAGHSPVRVATTAKVHLKKSADGFDIPKIELDTEADVPGVDDATFQQIAEAAKQGCPVSKALAATDIRLNARLLSTQETT